MAGAGHGGGAVAEVVEADRGEVGFAGGALELFEGVVGVEGAAIEVGEDVDARVAGPGAHRSPDLLGPVLLATALDGEADEQGFGGDESADAGFGFGGGVDAVDRGGAGCVLTTPEMPGTGNYWLATFATHADDASLLGGVLGIAILLPRAQQSRPSSSNALTYETADLARAGNPVTETRDPRRKAPAGVAGSCG